MNLRRSAFVTGDIALVGSDLSRISLAFYSYLVVNFYIAMEYIAMENGIIMGELWVNHGLIFKFDSFDNI